MKTTKLSPTRTIAQIAVFSAFSILLYLVPIFKFPLPFIFPVWLEFHFSDMPAILAGFMMGPWQGVAVLVVRALIKFTALDLGGIVGILADFLCGLAFVLPSSLIYKRFRTKKGAIIALLVGCLATTVMSIIANYFILIPFYVNFFNGKTGDGWGTIMGMFNQLFPQATKDTFFLFYIFLSVIPFNLLRSLICSLITFLIYKRLQRFFNFIFATKKSKNTEKVDDVCDKTQQNEEENVNKIENETIKTEE